MQPPLVSPLALPSSTQGQNLSGSTSNPSNSAREASKEKGDNQVSKTIACIKKKIAVVQPSSDNQKKKEYKNS